MLSKALPDCCLVSGEWEEGRNTCTSIKGRGFLRKAESFLSPPKLARLAASLKEFDTLGITALYPGQPRRRLWLVTKAWWPGSGSSCWAATAGALHYRCRSEPALYATICFSLPPTIQCLLPFPQSDLDTTPAISILSLLSLQNDSVP